MVITMRVSVMISFRRMRRMRVSYFWFKVGRHVYACVGGFDTGQAVITDNAARSCHGSKTKNLDGQPCFLFAGRGYQVLKPSGPQFRDQAPRSCTLMVCRPFLTESLLSADVGARGGG